MRYVKIFDDGAGKFVTSRLRLFRRWKSSHTRNQGKTLGLGQTSIRVGNPVWKEVDGEFKWVVRRVEANPKCSEVLESSSPAPLAGAGLFGGKKAEIEKRWRDLFAKPSQWCDHRVDNGNPKFPAFKHKKKTQRALWLDPAWIPPWVKEMLAALPPGTIPLSNFSSNERLSKCAKAGQYEKTLELFKQMQRGGMTPDRSTLFPVLKACANLGLLDYGRRIHTEIMQPRFEADLALDSSLVDMYAKCGSMNDAFKVFNNMRKKNVVAWTAMIVGFVDCGEGQRALDLFKRMQQQGVAPNAITFVGVLNACCSVTALEEGRQAHEEILRRGFDSDLFVGTCLVDMYAKCGSIQEAERVFNQMPVRDVVGWTAMIVGYVKCAQGQKAWELFEQMQRQGVVPNRFTFAGVLGAFSSGAALERGRRVHEEIIQRGYESDVIVGCCLIDMYSKCGSIKEAERVFNRMPTRDVVTWNAMILAYGSHGYTEEALETFRQMCKIEQVNRATFISLLTACKQGGLVEECLKYLKSMRVVYKVDPELEHYACAVDLLVRTGRLRQAEDLIRSMPLEPDASIWLSLLGACRRHGNVEMGERVSKRVLELDKDNVAANVFLSDTCAAPGKCDSSVRVNQRRFNTGLEKTQEAPVLS